MGPYSISIAIALLQLEIGQSFFKSRKKLFGTPAPSPPQVGGFGKLFIIMRCPEGSFMNYGLDWGCTLEGGVKYLWCITIGGTNF